MFNKVEGLSNEKHIDLRFAPMNSFDFATTVVNAPLCASEFFQAARYYPIVFPDGGTSPMALFNLNQKTNRYIDDQGAWKVPYVPAHIRRYPFIFAKQDKSEATNNFVVCIDIEAPHFATGQGEPMFTANGELSQFTNKMIEFLKKYHQELDMTQMICRELETTGVLVDKKITIDKDGQKIQIGGFRCVDIEKMNNLEDAVLSKWVRNGLISIVNSHLQSLVNLKELVSTTLS